MPSEKGRPWCSKAGMYLFSEPERRDAHKQCESCTNLIYVGCPDFLGNTKTALRRTEDYLRWLRGEAICGDSPLFEKPTKGKIE